MTWATAAIAGACWVWLVLLVFGYARLQRNIRELHAFLSVEVGPAAPTEAPEPPPRGADRPNG